MIQAHGLDDSSVGSSPLVEEDCLNEDGIFEEFGPPSNPTSNQQTSCDVQGPSSPLVDINRTFEAVQRCYIKPLSSPSVFNVFFSSITTCNDRFFDWLSHCSFDAV